MHAFTAVSFPLSTPLNCIQHIFIQSEYLISFVTSSLIHELLRSMLLNFHILGVFRYLSVNLMYNFYFLSGQTYLVWFRFTWIYCSKYVLVECSMHTWKEWICCCCSDFRFSSGIISFQPEKLPLAFLLEQICWQQIWHTTYCISSKFELYIEHFEYGMDTGSYNILENVNSFFF